MGRKSSIDRLDPEIKAYIQAMLASGIDYTIFFYNPNIHPLKEYELRKNENIRFAEQFGVPFVDADYDRDNWFERAKGMLMARLNLSEEAAFRMLQKTSMDQNRRLLDVAEAALALPDIAFARPAEI